MKFYGKAANTILQALKGEGQESGHVEFEEGQDITQSIETEGPVQRFSPIKPGPPK